MSAGQVSGGAWPRAGGWARVAAVLAAALAVSACSMMPSFLGGPPERPRPAELGPNPNLLPARQAWTSRLGPVDFPLSVNVSANVVTVGAADGTVAAFDAASGAALWRASAGAALSAAVGSDGQLAAVVTRGNEIVAFSGGQVRWRQRLGGQAYTAPLVAGARVFVLAADRSVAAFDGATGRRLWTQQRTGESLVLRQAGVLLAVGDTLVVGQSGRLAGLDPANGAVRWEAAIGSSRGANDVERLIDLVGRVSRVGDTVCARSFQVAVGCVDARQGRLLWTRPASGGEGVDGDERQVFGTESDGKVVAWRRGDGERAWVTDRLLHRGLTAPLLGGRSLAIGDGFGFVHLLSREDGSLLGRLSTDGTAIAAAPALAGNTLVVVTRGGGLFGFVPE